MAQRASEDKLFKHLGPLAVVCLLGSIPGGVRYADYEWGGFLHGAYSFGRLTLNVNIRDPILAAHKSRGSLDCFSPPGE